MLIACIDFAVIPFCHNYLFAMQTLRGFNLCVGTVRSKLQNARRVPLLGSSERPESTSEPYSGAGLRLPVEFAPGEELPNASERRLLGHAGPREQPGIVPHSRTGHPRCLCRRRHGRDGTVVTSVGKGRIGGQPDATTPLC